MRWLKEASVSRAELFYHASHGRDFDDAEATMPGEGDVDLVMWNDGFTSSKFVTDMLTGVLRYEEATAVEMMWRVHNEGSAVVWTGAAADALERAQQIAKAAREAEMPLRLELRERR